MNTNTPNILMVAPSYFPYMGGLETHVHEVGCRLSRLGVNLTLLTTISPHHISQLPQEEKVEGMRIIRVPAWLRESEYYIAPEIYSIIKNGNWDLVHCQGCHTFVPPVAMLAARKAKLPYILTFHTGGHSSGWRNKIRKAQWRIQRPLLAHATKLIGVSQFEAEYFREVLHLPKEQFIVIPNGAVLPDTAHLASVKPNRTLIASVGRLERYKGHQRLITALPRIREQRPDAHLLIVGKGPYETTLRQLAQKVGMADHVEIRFVASSDRQGMAELLSQVALVTLLSEYEAHPIAVMEALALQRPVLVADTSGLREIAEQGFARSISLNSTPDEIAQAALQQIEAPLVPPGHLELPTWEDCVKQLLAVYDEAIGGIGAFAHAALI